MLKKYSVLLLCWVYSHHLAIGQESKPKVVATASMIADMINVIGGDHLELECIVPIGGDPHLYDATPADAQLVNKADLIFKNGLTFEGWLNELIENAGSSAKVITVTDGIQAIESLQYANATDPHAWMDVSLGLQYIKNIKDALLAFDPEHADEFQANYDTYYEDMKALDAYIEKEINSIPEAQRILITSHDAFQYYGRRYGIQLESVLGTSTDADVQTADIIRLNKVIKENAVPALFVESTINPKVLEQIASDHDIKIGGKLFADSLGDEASPASTYLKMMRHNTDVIVKALRRSSDAADKEAKVDTASKWWLYGIIIGICLLAFFLVTKRLS